MLRRLFTMATDVATKKLKMSPPLIGTHNGHFHADEALAVYMLRLLPDYSSSSLVRTRDQAVLDTCHTVVDVGGEYNAGTNRYDHHQRTFNTTFPSHATKLSSAGLVYMHFGRAIIAQHTKLPSDHPDVSLLHEKLYDDFVEAVDAHDNGISKYDGSKLDAAGIQRRFRDGGVTLASLVGDMNYEDPLSTEPSKSTPEQPQAEEDSRFLGASKLMGTAFLRKLHSAATAWLPARSTIKEAYSSRSKQHPSGQILVLPKAGVPWKEHLYNMEESDSLSEGKRLLYVLYPENEQKDAKWRIQAVGKDAASFESRKALPEAWRGVRDSELDGVLGSEIEDGAVFVHASGFIGGHKTEAGARAMASKALEL